MCGICFEKLNKEREEYKKNSDDYKTCDWCHGTGLDPRPQNRFERLFRLCGDDCWCCGGVKYCSVFKDCLTNGQCPPGGF